MRTASFEAEVLADLLDGADDEGVEDFADEAIAEAEGYADEDTDYIGEVRRDLTQILMTMAKHTWGIRRALLARLVATAYTPVIGQRMSLSPALQQAAL